MRKIIEYKIENEDKARKLFVKAIKEYEAHNKREGSGAKMFFV